MINLRFLGDEILRAPCDDVDIGDTVLCKKLGNAFREAYNEFNCVGVSAPQLGYKLHAFLLASRPIAAYPHAPVIEPIIMYNPLITSHGLTQELGWEGCLSIPGLRGNVSRWKNIAVEYMDEKGGKQSIALEGFPARIFQHEYDHIKGILFIDRVSSGDLVSDKRYQENIL